MFVTKRRSIHTTPTPDRHFVVHGQTESVSNHIRGVLHRSHYDSHADETPTDIEVVTDKEQVHQRHQNAQRARHDVAVQIREVRVRDAVVLRQIGGLFRHSNR